MLNRYFHDDPFFIASCKKFYGVGKIILDYLRLYLYKLAKKKSQKAYRESETNGEKDKREGERESGREPRGKRG